MTRGNVFSGGNVFDGWRMSSAGVSGGENVLGSWEMSSEGGTFSTCGSSTAGEMSSKERLQQG